MGEEIATHWDQWGTIGPAFPKDSGLTDSEESMTTATLRQFIKSTGIDPATLFSEMDADSGGSISLQELMESAAASSLSKGRAKAMFTLLDKNGDGRISLEEFKHLLPDALSNQAAALV